MTESCHTPQVHNIFNVVCSALLQPTNQKALVEGEGIELMVIMLQVRVAGVCQMGCGCVGGG